MSLYGRLQFVASVRQGDLSDDLQWFVTLRSATNQRSSNINDYGANLCRYSIEVMNALTITAFTKLPLNWLNLPSQKLKPAKSESGASFGLRRRYPKYCIDTNALLNSAAFKSAFSATDRNTEARFVTSAGVEPNTATRLALSVDDSTMPAFVANCVTN